MLLWLILSAICVNFVHGYLLWSQCHERKWSISVHAARDKKIYQLYVAGHALGGLFFLLFSYNFFVTKYHVNWLFMLASITVFFEYIQALLPAKGKWDLPHSLAAYAMWVFDITTVICASLVLSVRTSTQAMSSLFIAVTLGLYVYAHFNRHKLYLMQMIMIATMYSSLLVLVIGG